MLKGETRTNLWGYSAILCVCVGGGQRTICEGPSSHSTMLVLWVGLQMVDLEASTLPCSAISLAHRKRSLDMSIWEKQKQKNPCFSQQANPETEFLFPVMLHCVLTTSGSSQFSPLSLSTSSVVLKTCAFPSWILYLAILPKYEWKWKNSLITVMYESSTERKI